MWCLGLMGKVDTREGVVWRERGECVGVGVGVVGRDTGGGGTGCDIE